jgi:hypothetical protein
MQRFSSGDPVLILPKFSHLYPGGSGVVTRVKLNAFRPMFNEYAIEFADGSTDNLFEFQILENSPAYQTFIANNVFDSYLQPSLTQFRGHTTDRHVVLQTDAVDIDLKIAVTRSQATIVGQVLERGTSQMLGGAEITVMQDSNPIDVTVTDKFGAFKFTSIPVGPLNIQVLSPTKLWRILGTLSVSM